MFRKISPAPYTGNVSVPRKAANIFRERPLEKPAALLRPLYCNGPAEGRMFRDSPEDAELFEPPHIPGGYRLRRHFSPYCGVSTRVRHPYCSFYQVAAAGDRSPAAVSPVVSCCPGRMRASFPFSGAAPGAGALRPGCSGSAPDGYSSGRPTTSWPSSRPGSGPARPSHGTGYG